MSFLHAALPSSDEEDDDYRPEVDKTAEADDRAAFLEQQAKRARGDEDEEDEDDYGASLLRDDGDAPVDRRTAAKRAKISHLWDLLNGKAPATDQADGEEGAAPLSEPSVAHTPAPPASAPPKLVGAGAAAVARLGPSNNINLASLCRTVEPKERKQVNSDHIWMRSLGLTPKATPGAAQPMPKRDSTPSGPAAIVARALISPQQQQRIAQQAAGGSEADGALGASTAGSTGASESSRPQPSSQPMSEEAKALAAAALAAARGTSSLAAVRAQGKVQVTETRRFAGKDIKVTLTVDKDSKEAQRAAAAAAKQETAPKVSGLDAFLAEVARKKKVNVLDKTKADWEALKGKDAALEEELEAHRRSGTKYLDKVDFLKRAELREYEKERDNRLASDVRTRGRL